MRFMLRLGLLNIRRRKVRTLLTICGVAIGVLSTISLFAIGNGLKHALLSELDDNESVTEITIVPQNSNKKDNVLKRRNIEKISKMDMVEKVYPRYSVDACIKIKNYESYVTIYGITNEEMACLDLANGSFLENRINKPNLYLGNTITNFLYNPYTMKSYKEVEELKLEELIGTKIDITIASFDNSFTDKFYIAGVLNGGDEHYSSRSQDIYCDMDVMLRYLNINKNDTAFNYSSAVIVVDDIDNVDFMVKKLQDMGYQTDNNKELLDSARRESKVLQILLTCIGMIALIVAAIGIINTMTTSVYERIYEIGLIKVLGCDLDELTFMFLFEAGFLGLSGGLVGTLLAYLLNDFFNKLVVSALKIEYITKLSIIPSYMPFVALLLSTLLSMAAGYLPARWSKKINPLSALNNCL